MMIRQLSILFLLLAISNYCFAHNKTLIGIVPFEGGATSNERIDYEQPSKNSSKEHIVAIQDAVADAFLSTKRFSLVEREKMYQLTSEKNLQKNEDFIDGQVIEQSRSLGAQYVVVGNVTKATLVTTQTTLPNLSSIVSAVQPGF